MTACFYVSGVVGQWGAIYHDVLAKSKKSLTDLEKAPSDLLFLIVPHWVLVSLTDPEVGFLGFRKQSAGFTTSRGRTPLLNPVNPVHPVFVNLF